MAFVGVVERRAGLADIVSGFGRVGVWVVAGGVWSGVGHVGPPHESWCRLVVVRCS